MNEPTRVRAFRPRKSDYPHFVAEDDEALAGMEGGFVSAEQCDGCGNSTYLIEKRGGRFVARCAVDPTDDPEFRHSDPCGTSYPIQWWEDSEVVF